MIAPIIKVLGHHATHKVIAKHTQGTRLDMKLGFALLRDRRVSLWPKLFALGLGGGIAALLIALEFPLETLLGLLLPVFGIVLDMVIDGLEIVAVPILLSALLLPFLAPKALVQQIMAERAGVGTVPMPNTPMLPADPQAWQNPARS